jgi:hypothetical protein
MAVLTEGEVRLKEQIELQKGISQTDEDFKKILLNSKQYQQMLRGINRQLAEHITQYGNIKEKNEEIFDKIFNYSRIISNPKLSSGFNNIYKSINKASDEFRDLNSQLQTGGVSLKEYKKSFDKLENVKNIINRQKDLLNMQKDSIQKELDADKELLEIKREQRRMFNDETSEDFEAKLRQEEKLISDYRTRIQGIEERLRATSYIKRSEREKLLNELVQQESKFKISEAKISYLQSNINAAPKKSEIDRLQTSVSDNEGELKNINTINEELAKSEILVSDTLKDYKKSGEQIEKIDKKIGNIGRTMGVMKNLGFNKLFDFKAIEDSMKAAAQMQNNLRLEREQQKEDREIGIESAKNADDIKVPKFAVARAGASAIGGELKEKFGVGGAISGGMYLAKQILDLIFLFDERWREISKNQGMVRSDAVGLLNSYQMMSKENKQLDLYGMSIRKTAATQKELMDATLSISDALGVNYTIANKQEGDLIANIKERMGLGDDVRQSLLEGSLVANEGFNEYFNKILGVNAINRANNKFYMNDKALLTDMSKASSSIRLQFRNHSMDLAKIVIDSKQYGANLQQLDGAMGGMLDWEKQLELQTSFFAQTGQLIDTSRLQYFSMYNDIENFQKEFDKLTGTAKEYEGLTRFAQQTKAEMFGMDREGYAQMLLDKELMKKINADETMKKQFDNRQTEIQMKKEYDRLKDMGLSYEKIAETLGENSQLLLSQQKISDDFGKAIEKIKNTFASFVENEDIENLLQSMSNLISGASEFLMEHGELFGMRTKKAVEYEYRESKYGIGGKNIKESLFQKKDIDEGIREDAQKDLEFLTRQYLKDYNISFKYLKDFSKQVEDGLRKVSDEQLESIGLPNYMKNKTEAYIKKNPKSIEKIQDGMISPNGNIVIKTPIGDILPNAKDYIITTTNPSALLSNNASQNITQYLIDETKMVSTMEMVKKAVEQQTIEIVKAVSQNRDVNLNGRKVGEMINMSNNRI